jgi:hypothetical protein
MSKLYFGDRVAVLNVSFFRTERVFMSQIKKQTHMKVPQNRNHALIFCPHDNLPKSNSKSLSKCH